MVGPVMRGARPRPGDRVTDRLSGGAHGDRGRVSADYCPVAGVLSPSRPVRGAFAHR